MRRPVKPFVTEYRGGTRRQAGQSSRSDPLKDELFKIDPDAPEPRHASQPWPSAPEDGYEAALRAADALFSGGRAPAPSEADAVDSEGADADPAAHAGGGRVLRVLDEPESPEMARLEAEFAPKRRGRKPGSKNKPKVPALMGGGDSISPFDRAPYERAPYERDPAAVDTSAAVDASAAPAFATPASDEPYAEPYSVSVPAATKRPVVFVARPSGIAIVAAAPRGERYAWVRTRLKPGEQWKRRLPKVAW